MKTAIFCRVSSKEQEETGYSLPAQEKFLREYAEKQGLEVGRVFAISESAAGKIQRKTFNEMLEFVRKKNICSIVVETTDRLTRNFSDVPTIDKWIMEDDQHQVHLAKEGCVLHNASRSHEWFMWRVKVATAEYYVRLLSENVKKGQKEKLAQGWIPTKPPLGYKTVGETGHKIHIIDEGSAPLVRKMFELYASGDYSIKRLAQTMYDEGMRSPQGNRLVNSRLHSLLRDPFYIGKIRWNDEIHEGKHQPLISKELFDKVQALLVSKTTPKYNKHDYLFKGMIRCAECDGLITWEMHRGHHYGHCNHYHACTQEGWVKEPEVEEQLLSGFDGLKLKNSRIVDWLKKALKESHQDEIEYHNSTVGELQARYEAIQKRMDKLYDDKLDEKITPDFYARKFKQYSEEKDEVAESMKRHSTASTGYLNLGINLYELSQRAREIYLQAKAKDMLDEQRALIRLVFGKLILNNGKLSWEYSKAFKILSEAVNETNCSKVDKIDDFENGKFEHRKKSDVTGQKGNLLPLRPIWLSSIVLNQQFSLLADSFLKGKLYFSTPPDNKIDLVLKDGKFFWHLSPFPAVLLMPFAFITSLFGTIFPQNLAHLALVIGTYFLIFKIALDCKFSPKAAYYMAFGFCFASVYLYVAFTPESWYFSHAVAVFFSFLSIYEYFHQRRYWLIGLLCSFVFLTRVTASFLVFFFVLEIIFSESKKNPKEKIQSLINLLVPMIVAGVLNLLYNYFRFGDLFDNGYKSSNAFWMTDAERFEQINYGLFQLRNIPTNIYYYFLKGLDPVVLNFRSYKENTYVLRPPYIKVGYPGVSFFVSSPMFLYIFRSDFSLKWVRHALLVILLTLFALLTYYWPGWPQIGPRYMLDLLPLSLVVLFTAFKDKETLPTLFKAIIFGSATLNIFLLFTMEP